MEKTLKIVLVLILMSLFLHALSFAEEEAALDPTRDQLVQRIKDMLGLGEELLAFLPELEVSFDETGQITNVLYNKDGVRLGLDQLDKETLSKLYNRVSSERIRVLNERTLRQIRREETRSRNERQLRQIQRLMEQERQLRQLRVR